MTFSKFFPVALMVALSAAVYVIAAQYLKVTALWVPFISWPLYFVVGSKFSRIHKQIIALTGGILFGYLTLLAVGPISNIVGSNLGLPVTVFFVAFIIVMLELTDLFELAPAYFFSYAGYFAYLFGGFAGQGVSNAAAMVPYWILLMVGLGLAVITAFLRTNILNMFGVRGEAQVTVFDKEKK